MEISGKEYKIDDLQRLWFGILDIAWRRPDKLGLQWTLADARCAVSFSSLLELTLLNIPLYQPMLLTLIFPRQGINDQIQFSFILGSGLLGKFSIVSFVTVKICENKGK